MLQKKRLKLYKSLIFKELLIISCSSLKLCKLPQLNSLEFSNKTKLNNTSHFFKKITFLGLALSNIFYFKYNNLRIKSVMNSL